MAHGGQPQVTRIIFPSQFPGSAWALTDNQGVYVARPEGEGYTIEWLCEDSVAPSAGILGVAPLTADRWVLATAAGLYITTDGGCNFERAPAPVDTVRPVTISPRPDRPLELAVATDTFGERNDVYVTEDGGETWTGAGLDLRGPLWQLVRSETDPNHLYLIGQGGAFVSEDGGRAFEPMKLGPPALNATLQEMVLLAAPANHQNELYAIIERFPTSYLIRSDNLGQDWVTVQELTDFPVKMVFDQAGERALVVSAFGDPLLSEDGGRTFNPAPEVTPLLCLDREAGSDRLWGCSNVFFGGPWVLGASDDFGETWQPIFTRFELIDSRWQCAPEDQARQCCDSLCPGVPVGGICDDASPEPPPAECEIPFNQPDAGMMPDAGPGTPDAGPDRPDADLNADAGVDPPDANPAGGAGGGQTGGAGGAPTGGSGAMGGAPAGGSGGDAPPQDAGFNDGGVSGGGGGGDDCTQGPRGPSAWLLWLVPLALATRRGDRRRR